MLTGTLQTGEYQLTAWAPGTCDRAATQLTEALQHHRHPLLNCMQNPSGSIVQAVSPAPPVRGRPAFWMRGRFLTGVTAIFTVFRQPGVRTYQGLCVPEADGLSVYFQLCRVHGEHGFPLGGAAQLFRHHLHLLGPDPANWTTRRLS